MSCEAGPEVKRKSERKYGCMKDKNAPEYGGGGGGVMADSRISVTY